MGYKWHPVVRIHPANGLPTGIDLEEVFTDASGANRIRLRYRDLSIKNQDINLRSLRIDQGFRPEVDLDFDLLTIEDQASIATIVNALNTAGTKVTLSLDGGVVHREVVLGAYPEPVPLRGKTVIGARFRLSLVCVESVDAIPEMLTDPRDTREFITNGDFAEWVSSTDPAWWGQGTTNGTINRDTSIYLVGNDSCRMDRTGAGSIGPDIYVPLDGVKFVPGQWYELQFWVRADYTDDDACGYRLWNDTEGLNHQPDGTWLASPSIIRVGVTDSVWTSYTVRFRVLPTFGENDFYRLGLTHRESITSQSMWFDAVRIYGPVLPPGVATW